MSTFVGVDECSKVVNIVAMYQHPRPVLGLLVQRLHLRMYVYIRVYICVYTVVVDIVAMYPTPTPRPGTHCAAPPPTYVRVCVCMYM